MATWTNTQGGITVTATCAEDTPIANISNITVTVSQNGQQKKPSQLSAALGFYRFLYAEVDNAQYDSASFTLIPSDTYDGEDYDLRVGLVGMSKYTEPGSSTQIDAMGMSTFLRIPITTAQGYSAPMISAFHVERTNAAGEDDPMGDHAKTVMSYSVSEAATWTVRYRQKGTGTYVEFASGTAMPAGGEVTDPGVTLDTDAEYEFTLTVTDQHMSKHATSTLPMGFILMDFKAGGRGIAFGQASVADNFTCALDADFRGAVNIGGALTAGNITANSATNSTYASRVGSTSSHPAIGTIQNPVYVRSDGAVAATNLTWKRVKSDSKNGTFTITGVPIGHKYARCYCHAGSRRSCMDFRIESGTLYVPVTILCNVPTSDSLLIYAATWELTTASTSDTEKSLTFTIKKNNTYNYPSSSKAGTNEVYIDDVFTYDWY